MAGYGFHTGALQAIEAATGWDPRRAEVVVGTSSGSIVAAIVRSGVSAVELRARVVATGPGAESDAPLDAITGPENFRLPLIWKGPGAPGLIASELLRGRGIRPSNLLVGVLPRGRVPTAPLRELIEQFHPDQVWPDELLWIPATDLHSGKRVIFGRDRTDLDVATAVEASCAIPGYFAPVEVDDHHLVDGGMRSPDNADLLIGRGLDAVVISSPLSVDQYRMRRSPIVGALRAYPRRRLRANVAALRAAGTEVLVLEPDGMLAREVGINAMNPDKLRPVVVSSALRINEYLAELEGLDMSQQIEHSDHDAGVTGELAAARRAFDVLTS